MTLRNTRPIAAGRLDLVHDLLCRGRVGALAAAAGAGIVDDDLGALRRHQLCDFAADTAPRTGADRDPSIKHAHAAVPLETLSWSRQLSRPLSGCQFARHRLPLPRKRGK